MNKKLIDDFIKLYGKIDEYLMDLNEEDKISEKDKKMVEYINDNIICIQGLSMEYEDIIEEILNK